MNFHDQHNTDTGSHDRPALVMEEDLRSLREMICRQKQQLEETDRLLKQALTELAERDRIIAVKDGELAEKDKIIAAMEKELADEKAKIRAHIDWLKRQVFGKKSRRSSTLDKDLINGQMKMLFPDYFSEKEASPENGSNKEGVPSDDISADADGSEAASSGQFSFPGEFLLVEENAGEGKKIRIDSYTRTTGRTVSQKVTYDELIAGLPQNRIEIPAAENERACPECGTEMVHLGWEKIRSEIIVRPAVYEANVYYAETLKCESCYSRDKTVIVKTNHVSEAVIPRSLASASFIAHTAVMKYSLYVPNYRLEKYILMYGVKLTRATMANQLIFVSENYLAVIWEWLHGIIINRPVVNADETPGKVNHFKELTPLTDDKGQLIDRNIRESAQAELDKEAKDSSDDGKLKQKQIYMWTYTSRYGTDHPVLLYDYQPSRKGECCVNFLGKDYCGYLIIDGYAGYKKLKQSTRCSCLAHFRAYWYEAIKTKEGQLDKTDPAAIGFLFSNRLFQIERDLSYEKPEDRYKERLKKEKPLWKKFWEWQEGIEASGGSPLQQALIYARNHKDTLENYMLDGNLPITNVAAELMARSYATARKNFLFHESAEGARSAAIIMSLIETARANGINPELYLTELLEHRDEYLYDRKKRDEFMPWSDRMKRACAFKNTDEANEPKD